MELLENRMNDIGKRLKAARLFWGHTQAEAGRYFGYSHPKPRVWEIENGKRVPRAGTLKLVLRYIEDAERQAESEQSKQLVCSEFN